MDLKPDPDPDGMVEKLAIKMAEQDPALQVLTSAGRVASPIAYSRARGLLHEFWPLAYRAGREAAAQEARPMLNAVYSALDHASQLCCFHGARYAATGFQFGLPRCESCRQPWRVAQALDLVNRAREVDQPRTPSGCDGEDSPEERQR